MLLMKLTYRTEHKWLPAFAAKQKCRESPLVIVIQIRWIQAAPDQPNLSVLICQCLYVSAYIMCAMKLYIDHNIDDNI